MDQCRKTIQTFLQRSISGWRGLPGGCSADAIAGWISFNEGTGRTFRGTDATEYQFRSRKHVGFESEVFFYFHYQRLEFISTEYWSFDSAECIAILEALGSPERRLDFNWTHEVIGSGEWLYAARGISLGVIAATQLIAKVTVFPRCTPEVYCRRFYKTELAREFPRGDA
jgi:hypothetical protein